jgi:hypothetical protein
MGIESFTSDEVNKNSREWTKSEIIKGIKRLKEEKGQTPTLQQAINASYLPSNRTIKKKFDTWNNALHKSGFNVNEKHGHELDKEHKAKSEEEKPSVFNEVSVEDSFNILGEHTNKSKGEATEAIITSELLKRGVNVLSPYGENQRYDLVIDVNGELSKIQCKTGRVSDDTEVVIFATRSSSLRSDGYEKNQYGDIIDYFAVYAWEIDMLFIISPSKVADTQGRLRLTKPENNQVKGITFAADYTIDTFIDQVDGNAK